MPWITPKTDWKPGDVVLYTDFNRIEGNVDYLNVDLNQKIANTDTRISLLSQNFNTNISNLAKEYVQRKFASKYVMASDVLKKFIPYTLGTGYAVILPINEVWAYQFATQPSTYDLRLYSGFTQARVEATASFGEVKINYYDIRGQLVSTRNATYTDLSKFLNAFARGRIPNLIIKENNTLYRVVPDGYTLRYYALPTTTLSYPQAWGVSNGLWQIGRGRDEYGLPWSQTYSMHVAVGSGTNYSLIYKDLYDGSRNYMLKLQQPYGDYVSPPVKPAQWYHYNAIAFMMSHESGDRFVGIGAYLGGTTLDFKVIDLTNYSQQFASYLGTKWSLDAWDFSPDGKLLACYNTTDGKYLYALYDLTELNITGWNGLLGYYIVDKPTTSTGSNINYHQIFWLADNLWGETFEYISADGSCSWFRGRLLRPHPTALWLWWDLSVQPSGVYHYAPFMAIWNCSAILTPALVSSTGNGSLESLTSYGAHLIVAY